MAIDQVGIDDVVDIGFIDVCIPGALGVDDANGAFLAAIEATGLVNAHLARPGQAQLFYAVLCILTHPGRTTAIAGWPFRVRATVVAAKKDVPFVVRHGLKVGPEHCIRNRENSTLTAWKDSIRDSTG
jgi:hypothetical protein